MLTVRKLLLLLADFGNELLLTLEPLFSLWLATVGVGARIVLGGQRDRLIEADAVCTSARAAVLL